MMHRFQPYSTTGRSKSQSSLNRALKMLFAALIALSVLATPGTAGTRAWGMPATATIAVEGIEGGAAVNAYRVIVVNYDESTLAPEDPLFSWAPEIQEWVRAHFPLYIDDAGDVTEAFDAELSDEGELVDHRPNGEAASFYSMLAAAIASGDVATDAVGHRSGPGEIENMEFGGYLILIEHGLNVYRPSAVTLAPVWDEDTKSWKAPDSESAIVKASEVPIAKTVNGTSSDTVSIGEDVGFEISASVPVYPDGALSTSYTIADTLPAGLTFLPETLEVFGIDAEGETPLSQGSHFSDSKEGDEAFRLDFDYNAIARYETIRVSYSAKANENVAIGPEANSNEALVGYSNDPFVIDSTAENTSTATVYSYGIEVLKVDTDQQPLPGAEFSLAHADDPASPFEFVQSAPGRYRLAADEEQGTTTLATDDKGVLFIEGIDRGKYLLTEVKAPDGYLRPSEPFEISVADENKDGLLEGPSQNSGFAFVQIRNTQGFALPATGGIGSTLIIGVGIVSIASAVVLRAASTKRKENPLR